MPDRYKSLLLLLPVIITIVFSFYLQSLVVHNQAQLTNWLSQFGSYVIIVYIVLQAITIIFAPLGGFFLLVAMIALFGPAIALALAYLVTTPCYQINFYLAKKYGRPMVEKVVGKKSLRGIDHFAEDAGLPMLVVLRIFQSSNFDYLSYGFGLTTIPFKMFTTVNFLAGIPAAYISYLIYSRSGSLTQGVVIGYVVGALFALLAILLNYLLSKKTKR